MTVLWAMSLWAAMIVLAASGYGASELRMFRLNRWKIVLAGLIVWALGWQTSHWPHLHVTLNLGFGGLTGGALAWVVLKGQVRWWVVGMWLFLVATIVRMALPFGMAQATVLPIAAIEGVGMGFAVGIAVPKPLAAALLAAATEGLAAVAFALCHSTHDLGRYDLAVVMLASLSAWLVAWVTAGLGQRIGRSA
ncbi:MAG: hypothetical protein C7B45_09520 [Sulfobacillus acidophilus]|uniref:Uncharacterized protein n=1 Tax=Sulfobacillus acidophilus TaxID=53633 RepID=A0A2T2WHJ9_9FIRM|nr:MAG: hypothetical protein C7B45_09520 [Sulfobacillus acidophilus]